MKGQTKTKNYANTYFIVVLLILLTAFIVGGSVYFWQQGKITKFQLEKPKLTPTQQPIPTAVPTVIKITNTPIPTSTSEAVLTPEVTEEARSDKYLITEAFADKYGKPVNEINVSITDNRGKYASGNVSFEGEVGGGMWYAGKNDKGEWVIAYDGHGTIPCGDIEPYDFPTDMISECWDKDTGGLIIR